MQNLFISIIMLLSPIELTSTNVEIEESSLEEIGVVTVTTYTSTSGECDSSPNVTASGFKISKRNPKKHRIIAVSRDLKRKLNFGQKVKVTGAGKYNGEYVVRDVMNKRYKRHIDILINPEDKQTKFSKVKIYKVKDKKDLEL
jgi:3D (Asp-Asp-Asp) domain-containing protein